jgi:septal ring factor EnvC (AmiA/AmiB activator)
MMDWLKKLFATILGLFGLSTILSANKSKEVKELKKIIKETKTKEKKVAKEIEKLQDDKQANKKDITNLKRNLTRTKNEIKKMEEASKNDDISDAAEFLRKFSKK